MTNDAKLGLVAGVAGVVAAAVFGRGPYGADAAVAPPAVVRTAEERGQKTDDRKADARGGRPEVAAVAVSRAADDDD